MKKISIILIALSLAMLPVSQAGIINRLPRAFSGVETGDYTENLVLWLESDADVAALGTWQDKSVEDNDCVLSGDAFVTDGLGITLDGDDFGTVAVAAELELGASDFSITAWVLTTTDAEQTAASYGNGSGVEKGTRLYATWASTESARGHTADGLDASDVDGTTNVHDGAWHWICYVADKSGNAQIYVDGGAAEAIDDMTDVGNITTNDHDDWSIGREWIGSWSRYFTGTIDDIRIYSVALNASQRTRIYNAGSPRLDPYTFFLGHYDGSDAATSAVDSSVSGVDSPHAITFVSTAQLDTADKKYGTAALLLNGSTEYTTCVDSDDWDFGTGDFTVECWVKLHTLASVQAILAFGSLDNSGRWHLFIEDTTFGLMFEAVVSSAFEDVREGSVATWNTTSWHHVAACRQSGTVRLYHDGTQVDTDAGMTEDYGFTGLLYVGRSSFASIYHLDGWIDEVRVTKGLCRYPDGTAFTPAGPFLP